MPTDPTPPRFWTSLCDHLAANGTDFVAGFPSDTPSLVDAACLHSELTAVVPRDQKMLGPMAAGYTHRTGRPAAIEISSGPSLANAVTGLAELASMGLPAVVVVGSVPESRRGRGDFQDLAQRSLLEPLSVWYHAVDDPADVPWAVRTALWQARGPRPGLAVLDIPFPVGDGDPAPAPTDAAPTTPPTADCSPSDVDTAAELLRRSERPLILIGGGARAAGAGAESLALAEVLEAPILSTASGRGCVPEDRDPYLGLAGLYRNPAVAEAVEHADAVVCAGSRLEETARMKWDGLERTALIRIDTDHNAQSSGPEADVFLRADARTALRRLTAALPARDRTAWRAERVRARENLLDRAGGGSVAATLRALTDAYDDSPWLLAQENGFHDLWGYDFPTLHLGRNGSVVTPGEQTMMGFALPALLGAAMADTGEDLVAACGDGALEMSMPALATLRRHRIGATVLVWDNGGWGWPRSERTATAHLMDFGESRTLPSLAGMFDAVLDADDPTTSLRTAKENARKGELSLIAVSADDAAAPPAADEESPGPEGGHG
ncbi:thiamine pyrophosphate-binding protein [Salininema proteolyticum]|uniref:Thiamine pyrophosphate-binding protein n=1 Tax=Salininema proteolyticum TaxID=1607685 RepID=A0ABV8U1F2_9ACTN